jgi:hypothetical protein
LGRGKFDEGSISVESGKWGDQMEVWAVPLVVALDNPLKRIATRLSTVLPIGAKIFADGSYLRAMFGSFSAVLMVASVVSGIVGVIQTHGLLVLPSTLVVATIVLIGTFDVLSGFLGATTLVIGLAITAGIHTPADIRFIFGILALAVVPRVISGAFRTLKREASDSPSYLWERFLDYVLSPMLAASAVGQIVGMLPVLAGIALPVEDLTKVLPVAVAIGMVTRVSLEEIAGRYFPNRITHVHADNLPAAPLTQVIISNILRGVTFGFISIALVGVSWHLFVGAALFILPNLLSLIQHKLPNSKTLYHLLPKGLTNLCLTLWMGQISLLFLTGAFQETPDLAKIGFVLLPIPGLILSLLKLFGRKGHENKTRFFEKPSMVWVSRLGTLSMVYAAAELTHTINLTNLF